MSSTSTTRSQEFHPKVASSSAELLESFDAAVASGCRSLEATSNEHQLTPWAFKMGGHPISQGRRHIMIANAVFSHLAHHRGQLTVYLRLSEATMPALYDASADEQF